MAERREEAPRSSRREEPLAKAREELAAFESEYTIERITQRDLILDLGAALWIATALVACVAGVIDPAPTTELQSILRFIMVGTGAMVSVLLLTLVHRLDDQRTLQLVTGLTVLALVYQFILSFYGPGATGGFYVAMVAVAIYVAQFLSLRGLVAVLSLVTVAIIGVTYFNADDPRMPHLISLDVVMLVTTWGITLALYQLRTDRLRAIAVAESTAFSDPLTGLPNTRMIRRRAETLLSARNQRINRPTGLVLLDLDGFRAANMLQGRRDGDRLLRAAAEAMVNAADAGQLVARTGSDEFTVLIPDTSPKQLDAAGERFRSAVLEALDKEARSSVRIDASVGTTISRAGGSGFDDLLREADRSMYLEKAAHERDGRLRPLVAAPALDPELNASLSEPAPARVHPTHRFDHLRWSNRPTQVRFASLAWLASTISVPIAQVMPDAPPTNWKILPFFTAFGIVTAVLRYVTPPSVRLSRQLFDVVSAGVVLAGVILVTGGDESVAWPITLFILIYAGWFLPLNWVVPGTAITMGIVLITLPLSPGDGLSLFDAVTIFGGTVIAITLLIVLYYNHYYLLRAQRLTDQLATLDPRAATNNRRAFEERMREELEQLSYGDTDALAVVMIDLGNFKSVSANYGRGIGDRMLALVAEALETASREGDCVARLGGDEFGVVAPGVDAESARALAGRLVEAVTETIEESDLPSNKEVRASAGFALYGMHGRTTDELVTAADIALTAAKTAPRDGDRVSSFVVAL